MKASKGCEYESVPHDQRYGSSVPFGDAEPDEAYFSGQDKNRAEVCDLRRELLKEIDARFYRFLSGMERSLKP